MEKLVRKIQIQKKARKISSQKVGLECGWGCVFDLGGGFGEVSGRTGCGIGGWLRRVDWGDEGGPGDKKMLEK
jgi:hypothetical protein